MEGARRSHKVYTHLALNRMTPPGILPCTSCDLIETAKPNGSRQVNKSRPSALVEMAKSELSSAGPMRTQPLQLGSIHPTQPLMPSAGTEMKVQNRPQRKR
jgi:hypothetical protein